MPPVAPHRSRRHGPVLDQGDRRSIERAGWRTLLSYRENHVRGWDGTLLDVQPVWLAEAERADRAATSRSVVLQVSAGTIDAAWVLLRARTEAADRLERQPGGRSHSAA